MQIAAARDRYHEITKDRTSDSRVRLMSEFISSNDINRINRLQNEKSKRENYEDSLLKPVQTYEEFKKMKLNLRTERKNQESSNEQKLKRARILENIVYKDKSIIKNKSDKSNSYIVSDPKKKLISFPMKSSCKSQNHTSDQSNNQKFTKSGYLLPKFLQKTAPSVFEKSENIFDKTIDLPPEKFLQKTEDNSSKSSGINTHHTNLQTDTSFPPKSTINENTTLISSYTTSSFQNIQLINGTVQTIPKNNKISINQFSNRSNQDFSFDSPQIPTININSATMRLQAAKFLNSLDIELSQKKDSNLRANSYAKQANEIQQTKFPPSNPFATVQYDYPKTQYSVPRYGIFVPINNEGNNG